jgi:hypothetical protein
MGKCGERLGGSRLFPSHSCSSGVRGLTLLRPEAQKKESMPCFAECLAGEKALISASHPQVFRPVPCRGTLYCYLEAAANLV